MCPRLRRRAVTQRHDSIAFFLRNFLCQAGAPAEIEPRLMDNSRTRPDLSYILPRDFTQTLFLLDVSIVHPTAQSVLPLALRPLAASHLRARQKTLKYQALAQKENATFIPFILESTGAFWRTVPQTLLQIADHCCNGDFEGLSPREVKRYLSRAIAVLLQRGNANILRQGLSYSSATARRVQ